MDSPKNHTSGSLGKRKRSAHNSEPLTSNPNTSRLYDPPTLHICQKTYPPHSSSPPRAKAYSFEVLPIDDSTAQITIKSDSFDHPMSPPKSPPTTHVSHTPYPRSPRLNRRSPKLRRRILRESSIVSKSNTMTNPEKTNLSTPTKVEQTALQECHICHKRPKMKSDLDSYGDCWRCKKRVCYICVRLCEANMCGGRKICSSCCVERGEEGMVSCLDCLGATEDSVMEDGCGHV